MRGFYGVYSLYGVKGSFNVNKWVLLIPYMIETGGFDLLFSQCNKNVCEKGTHVVFGNLATIDERHSNSKGFLRGWTENGKNPGSCMGSGWDTTQYAG